MSTEAILGKVDDLVKHIGETQGEFGERDVVYLLVEVYKIKERELGSREKIKAALRYVSFYRDWVVHTRIHDPGWYSAQEELNQPQKLLEQLLSLIETGDTREKIKSMWPSFVKALKQVVLDQNISPRYSGRPHRPRLVRQSRSN